MVLLASKTSLGQSSLPVGRRDQQRMQAGVQSIVQITSASPRYSEITRCGLIGRVRLLNHFVGARKQCRWHFEADRAGSRQVDDQFKLGRLHYREVGRLGSLEDFA